MLHNSNAQIGNSISKASNKRCPADQNKLAAGRGVEEECECGIKQHLQVTKCGGCYNITLLMKRILNHVFLLLKGQ